MPPAAIRLSITAERNLAYGLRKDGNKALSPATPPQDYRIRCAPRNSLKPVGAEAFQWAPRWGTQN